MPHQQAGFTIREAQPVDYPGAIEALTDAFSTDPVMIEAFGGAMDRAKLTELLKFQVNTTYAPKGKIDVAVDDNNTVLGASLWVDPQGQKGGMVSDVMRFPRFAKILGSSIVPASKLELRLWAARPRFDHWYLYTIGVRAGQRSRGIGAGLLDYRLQRLGGYPAYLEASTHRSAALYRRHGFIDLSEFPSGKPALGMWYPVPEQTSPEA